MSEALGEVWLFLELPNKQPVLTPQIHTILGGGAKYPPVALGSKILILQQGRIIAIDPVAEE